MNPPNENHRGNEIDADVIVVGSGMAGWTTARRSQECGLSVIVIDKGRSPGSANVRMSQGFMNAAYLGMKEDPELLKEYARELTAGLADDELIDVWADNCTRTVEWMISQGIEIDTLPEKRDRSYILPFRVPPQGLTDFDRTRGPDIAMTLHSRAFEENGGTYIAETRVSDLIVDDSQFVTGVVAQTPEGERRLTARAVVLADGGFQGNPSMLREHIGPAADRMKRRSLGTQTGDGIRMAQAIGATTTNMKYFYGHILSLDAMSNDDLWPYPMMDGAISNGILVQKDGKRFVDEDMCGTGLSRKAMSGITLANVIGRSDDPQGSIAILDSVGWEMEALDPDRGVFQGTFLANPTIAERGGTVWEAEDLAGLAAAAGIDAEELTTTVTEYNAAVLRGASQEMPIPRGRDPRPLDKPPYYAVPCVAAITATLGGLVISPNGEVLAASGEAIVGLYAAGGTIGGLSGGPFGGYLGGLGTAAVFGLLVAEHIAETLAPVD